MTGLNLLAAVFIVAAQPLPPAPPPVTIEMLRTAFTAQSGSDTVYFSGDSFGLDLSAQRTLAAQARWLRANPFVSVRIEGHGDDRVTRDHALAVAERRADAVRDFLILNGVPATQISIISWGKERPATDGGAASRVETVLMPPSF